MARLWPPGGSSWIGAMVAATWIVGREVLSELAFGSSGEWLEENTWLLGDFLAWQPVSTIIVSVGLVIVTAVIITRFSEKEEQKMSPDEQQPPRIHVESHDQKGGITAYQVNIQPGDRQLTADTAQQLKSYLDGVEFKSVNVTAVMGDGEAFRFASQIKNFLTSEDIDVKGVDQAIYSAPVQGQIIEPPNDEGLVKVVIGNR